MASTARLTGNGILFAGEEMMGVRYLLVVTLQRGRPSASGVVEGGELGLRQALGASNCRLRLADGPELRVSLRRKFSSGPVLVQSIGHMRFLRLALLA